MKILCSCDLAIPPKIMSLINDLDKFGAQVEMFEDSTLQTPKAITEAMLKAEHEGVESCQANDDLIKACKEVDILIVHTSFVNKKLIDAAQNLKYICVLRSGIENVNVDICKERGIHIINAPGRSAHAVADLTVAMMLAESRNIARGHKGLMEGKWLKTFVNFYYIHDMRNMTVGIIGAGQIGQKVIKRLSGFDSKIIVYDPYMTEEQIETLGYTPVSLDELLMQSDIISLHLRLSEKTERFFDKDQFAKMKKTAYFINTARAGLVDEPALVEALQNKTIGGAALDVFNTEPLGEDSPFLKLDNVTITPHIAGTSMDTFTYSVELIKDSLSKVFAGKPVADMII